MHKIFFSVQSSRNTYILYYYLDGKDGSVTYVSKPGRKLSNYISQYHSMTSLIALTYFKPKDRIQTKATSRNHLRRQNTAK